MIKLRLIAKLLLITLLIWTTELLVISTIVWHSLILYLACFGLLLIGILRLLLGILITTAHVTSLH